MRRSLLFAMVSLVVAAGCGKPADPMPGTWEAHVLPGPFTKPSDVAVIKFNAVDHSFVMTTPGPPARTAEGTYAWDGKLKMVSKKFNGIVLPNGGTPQTVVLSEDFKSLAFGSDLSSNNTVFHKKR